MIDLMPGFTRPRCVCSGLALALLLCACDRETAAPAPPRPAAEFGTAAAEQVFQQAEVLRYTVDQARLERQRLQRLGTAPAPPVDRPHPARRASP